ncbi:hypothetical protein EFR51_03760 [Latilactobacillus curvatus]|uniref:hypothetical protein n=1 Tax=Latilactobacillus curvatus TaxID=28038 RepID=UPI0021A4177C|nr:hypothetical protein [Latilactobacillus curvatus]MCT3532259.1 hypothetical protein [Latilactobacillus curvatus]
MSIYAIKDKDGELRDSTWGNQNTTGKFCAYTNISVSDARTKTDKHPGCSVVRLVEQPKPVEVSDVAEGWLTYLREGITRGGSVYAYIDMLKSEHDMSIEDIFHALDFGWTVKQPQRWCVKTPDNWMGNGKQGWLYKITGSINTISEDHRECTPDEQFTDEEIKKYHLDGFEKEEVTDDEV